ncbi:MAG: hypothetical protein NC115_12615 [Bacteroidales bacterium]|nr:hypothetical protein [Bacteroidales bacterium]
MKDTKAILTVAAILVAAACAKEPEQTPSSITGKITFHGYADAIGTKTALNSDFSVSWQDGDAISVFPETGDNLEFTVSEISEDGGKAIFEGTGPESAEWYAIYPYNASASLSGTDVYTELPAIQAATAGTFDPGAAVTAAKSSGTSLHFMNTGAIIGFSVIGKDVASVTLSSADGATMLAGKASISLDGEEPVLSILEGGSASIRMDGPFSDGEKYYFTVAPAVCNGLALTFTNTEGMICRRQNPSQATIGRCGNKWLGEFKIADSEWRPAEGIYTAAQFQAFLNNSDRYSAEDEIFLADDIDLDGISLEGGAGFSGTFDGRGHSIRNWTSDGISLFTEMGGTVKDLTLDSSCSLTPATGQDFGFITEKIAKGGILSGCVNNAGISLETGEIPASRIGAFTGTSYGFIHGCANNGNIDIKVTGNAGGNVYLGGLAGYVNSGSADVNLLDCSNSGDISLTIEGLAKKSFAGGISGGTSASDGISKATSSKGTIKDCTNTGNITYTVKNGGTLEDGAGIAANANYCNIGGVTGFWEGSIEDCTNGIPGDDSKGKVTLTIPTSTSEVCMTRPSAGGISAFILHSAKGCINYGTVNVKGSFGTSSVALGSGIAPQPTFGGVFGQAGPAEETEVYSISDCHNYGTVNIWCTGAELSAGGIAGHTVTAMEDCVNEGDINVDFTGSTSTRCCVGGCIGNMDAGAFQLTRLVNRGKLALNIPNTAGTGFHNYGGISGQMGQGAHKFVFCENYGEILYEGKAKMRIGGIASFIGNANSNKGSADGCTVKCSIIATCIGQNYSQIGGIIGYSQVTANNSWTFEGTVDTSVSTAKVLSGGLTGVANGSFNFNGCSFKGALNGAAGSSTPGLYIGGLNKDKQTMTFGKTARCIVGKGATVNGTEVTTLTNAVLVTQIRDNGGSYTSTGVLTDITIE